MNLYIYLYIFYMYLIIIWFTNQFLKISLSLELSFSDYSNLELMLDSISDFVYDWASEFWTFKP